MKKLTLIIFMLGMGLLSAMAQSKPKKQNWENVGVQSWGLKIDTSIISYALKGKDSVSVKIKTDNCSRLTQWIDYEGKLHNTKNMIRKSLVADFWRWEKDHTVVGKDTIKREEPRWVTSSGIGYSYSGIYTQNGKFIQPDYVVDKYGKHKVD